MISQLARNAVKQRLETAWATKLEAAREKYPDVAEADKTRLAVIDWTGAKKQIFEGQINIDQLEKSTAITWPVVIIYASSLSHDGVEKFVTFSGSVAVNVEVHYTWRKASALPNFDEYLDLIEETAIMTFHDRAWLGAIASGLSYRGEMTSERGSVQDAGESWTQAISFRLIFGVDL